MPAWMHAGPTLVAAFLASVVECVEALTIVLAVGTTRGWRPALAGAAAGAAVLAGMVALFGPLLSQIPLYLVQSVVGMLLLLFGMRWLRKAVLRGAGLIAKHDEALAYEAATGALRRAEGKGRAWDAVAVAASFKAVILEGLEVVFIVLATSTGGRGLGPAAAGALAALVAVSLLGLAVHRPLTRVPENTLKFCVGILLTAFGAFWTGEGLGFAWEGSDLAIPAIAGAFLVGALGAVQLCRMLTTPSRSASTAEGR
jgi:Ca2+/H+ antiporter, TMEM165/GDT1 family